MRLIGGVLLGCLGLAIASRYANADPPTARPLSMKEAVQLAMRQNPQRLIARLTVNERNQDKAIAKSALLPQADLVAGDGLKSFNAQSIMGGPNRVRVGPFQTMGNS